MVVTNLLHLKPLTHHQIWTLETLGSTYPLPRGDIRSVLLSFLLSVVRSQAWIALYSMVLKSSRDHDNTLKRVLQSDHRELRSEF